MRIGIYLALGVGVVALAQAQEAFAATDVSIDTASYTYSSWSPSGVSEANNIANNGGDSVTNNDVGYWTATTTFNASSSSVLTITDLAADDSVVLELNGTIISAASAGIFGPGSGYFIFTPTGSAAPWNFQDNGYFTPTNPLVLSTGLVNGANTLELIVNNNYDGIHGSSLTGGPSSLAFSGTVTSSVPEPSTWAMMLAGFAALAFSGYRAVRKGAVTAA